MTHGLVRDRATMTLSTDKDRKAEESGKLSDNKMLLGKLSRCGALLKSAIGKSQNRL
jgi:hypothetical protein